MPSSNTANGCHHTAEKDPIKYKPRTLLQMPAHPPTLASHAHLPWLATPITYTHHISWKGSS